MSAETKKRESIVNSIDFGYDPEHGPPVLDIADGKIAALVDEG